TTPSRWSCHAFSKRSAGCWGPLAMADEPQPAILLVDDDENNRYTLSRRLQRENYTDITEAVNGKQALELLRERPFDLILLDIMMPEMDGYETLGQLKSDMMLREIPVIMISAVDGIDSVVRCIEMGAEDYLPKPFNPVLLKARIGASLEKRRLRLQEESYTRDVETEKRRADDLLHSMLPPGAVRELKATNEVRPRRYEEVAVLFCDIVDFTSYCDKNPPEQVIAELQTLVEEYERIVAFHGMEKIKTIGRALRSRPGRRHAPRPSALGHSRRRASRTRGRRHCRPPAIPVRSVGRHGQHRFADRRRRQRQFDLHVEPRLDAHPPSLPGEKPWIVRAQGQGQARTGRVPVDQVKGASDETQQHRENPGHPCRRAARTGAARPQGAGLRCQAQGRRRVDGEKTARMRHRCHQRGRIHQGRRLAKLCREPFRRLLAAPARVGAADRAGQGPRGLS